MVPNAVVVVTWVAEPFGATVSVVRANGVRHTWKPSYASWQRLGRSVARAGLPTWVSTSSGTMVRLRDTK